MPNTQGPIALFFNFATRGQSCVARKAEKWAFWPILSNFKAVKGLNRWERTPKKHVKVSWGVPGFIPETFAHCR